MKTKFTSFDVACIVSELRKNIEGLRVVNVYDIDNKSYIIKLGQESKSLLYIESGSRIHTTAFEWPKQMMPSAFSAKCRKALKNKRLTKITQVGCDRVVDLQFGYNEHMFHLIVELYDRGNVCLCDYEYIITAVLRTRQDKKEDVRYAIGHYYPLDLCQKLIPPSIEFIKDNIPNIKPGSQLKRWINLLYPLSIPLIEHHIVQSSLDVNFQLTEKAVSDSLEIIFGIISSAYESFQSLPFQLDKGYIFLKEVKGSSSTLIMDEFHPCRFQHQLDSEFKEYASYNESIDVYFFEQESQKIEMKTIQQEKNVMRKLENIKKDHENRINALKDVQESSTMKAYLIEVNLELVNEAISTLQNLVANQLSWEEIDELIEEGRVNGNTAAIAIKNVNLVSNEMVMTLNDIYNEESEPVEVTISLDLGAYGNAEKYFHQVKQSSAKEQKTIQSSATALKNAEKLTDATINDINIVASIKKARKNLWFEKFLWFITSDGFIVIGGRDAQQNEIIVKKYLKKNDVYIHADIHGATSIIVKNKGEGDLPPRTLMEAGSFALCHSSAWNSKIVTSAYWVLAEQVSKTAPSGEYLTTGSFMIRGKKNYLPPTQLVLGFSILFKIDDESVQRRCAQKKLEPDSPKSSLQTGDVETILTETSITVLPAEEPIVGNDGALDDLFDKYNLQISAPTVPDSITAEITDLVGAPGKQNQRRQPKDTNFRPKTANEPKKDNKPKRGQKGKKKKLEKYADQSDDEREAVMALLGSAGVKKEKSKSSSNNSKLKYRVESTAKNVVANTGDKEEGKMREADRVILKLSKQDNDSSTLAEVETVPANCGTVSEQSSPPKELPKKEDTELRQAVEDPVDEGLNDEEEIPSDFLDSLILNPQPVDCILFGIPFVAPYTATSTCKFRVKLLPGSSKKGKACKTILELFARDKDAHVQEKNVFKSLKDVDMTTNIPGKVKISAPNLYGHSKR